MERMPKPHDIALAGTGEEPEASLPAQDAPLPEEGTDDDATILWMLSLTPSERLKVAQGFVNSVHALRNGRRS